MTTTVAKLDGADGQTLVADVIEPGAADSSGPTVLFLHGGGQTRGSWRATATRIAGEGWRTVSVDQRGHGESPWRPDGRYDNGDYAADLIAVARRWPRPVVVGASLGGLAGLLAVGELGLDVRGLVLVDVAVSNRVDGSDQIRGFMTAHPDGFADLDEAADAVAAYLPGRRMAAFGRRAAAEPAAPRGRPLPLALGPPVPRPRPGPRRGGAGTAGQRRAANHRTRPARPRWPQRARRRPRGVGTAGPDPPRTRVRCGQGASHGGRGRQRDVRPRGRPVRARDGGLRFSMKLSSWSC